MWSSVRESLQEAAGALAEVSADVASEATRLTVVAANHAGRLAERTRLYAQVTAKQQRIALIKQSWGSDSYDAMDAGDIATVATNFHRAKAEIQRVEEEIEAKLIEIAALDAAPAQSAETAVQQLPSSYSVDAWPGGDAAEARIQEAVPAMPVVTAVPGVMIGTAVSAIPAALPRALPARAKPEEGVAESSEDEGGV